VTGSIDAYLLYKDAEALMVEKEDEPSEETEQTEEA
jgi:hypothetical protein